MSHHKPNPNKNVNLIIDGIPVTVPEGTRILEAARKVDIHIPTLCDHPDLCKRAVCRLCVVECDGRGKLIAACANDVWEGVSIVTHNARLLSIRKMIIELLLANHPQDCLSCVRSTNCALQSLAADFGIRASPFRHDAMDHRPPVTESATLVRDMAKCVKCGRCVEACQEVQTIRTINTSHRGIHYEISAPYGQALADGPCVFCGHCAAVCPVGAIYEYDQSAEAWVALNDKERRVAVQFSPSLSEIVENALGLGAGTATPGRIVTALKRLGFDQVFDAQLFADAVTAEEHNELLNRNNLPMITGCSAGCIKFVEQFYPDLANHLSSCKNTPQMFSALVKKANPQTTAVSISGCLAQKFSYRSAPDSGLVLTVNELARMFRLGGINFDGLPETPFDTFAGTPETAASPAEYKDVQPGIQEATIVVKGKQIKMLIAHGFAPARVVMDSISKGECDAGVVKIKSCPL
jgi:NADH dehydrogenase/NADH:ubiquinone oxidoreductase subunit G